MIAIAMVVFNVFHPGRCLDFKAIVSQGHTGSKSVASASDVEMAMQQDRIHVV